MAKDQHHADYASYKTNGDKAEVLETVIESFKALSEDIDDWVANLSNCSSLLWYGYQSMNIRVNWTGFYVVNKKNGDELILGPFQGKVACQTIQIGKGVCGTAALTKQTQVVPDVEAFPGHIACDGETKSEIVVPIFDKGGSVVGVLDLDCLDLNGFDKVDQEWLEKLAQLITDSSKW